MKETGYSHASVQSFITQDGPRRAEQTNEKIAIKTEQHQHVLHISDEQLHTFFLFQTAAVYQRSASLLSSGLNYFLYCSGVNSSL